MRSFCIATVAAGLMLAPMASAQPLAPGKPAGVEAARLHVGTGLLIVGGLLVAGLVVAMASTGGTNNTGVINPAASAASTT
jgi:hypothetical protein